MGKHTRGNRPTVRKGLGGYADPPVKNQFKPGHSGHKKVAEKPASLRKQILGVVLNPITVRDGGKIKKMDPIEALMVQAIKSAMNNPKQLLPTLKFILETSDHEVKKGIFDDEQVDKSGSRFVTFELTEDELPMIDSIRDELGRHFVPAPRNDVDDELSTNKAAGDGGVDW